MSTPKSPSAKRREHRRLNRLARVRAAVDTGNDVQHLQTAYDYARGAIKRMPVEMRATARRDLAELIVNYALNELEIDDITRLEAVA